MTYLADFDILQNAAQLGAQYVISHARFHQSLNIENHNFLPERTTCDLPPPLMSENTGWFAMVTGVRQGKWVVWIITSAPDILPMLLL